MYAQVYRISLWLGCLSVGLLFLFSLVFCLRSDNPRYLRSFPIYCGANALAEVVAHIFPVTGRIDYDIFTLFELLYFSYFLSRLIDSRGTKRLIWTLAFLFLACFVLYTLHPALFDGAGWFIILECIIIIIPCLVYFMEVFSKPHTADLWVEPAFWMVTGILYYFFILIPTILFVYYFDSQHKPALALAVYSVNNYAQVISYLLFFKGMTCRLKK